MYSITQGDNSEELRIEVPGLTEVTGYTCQMYVIAPDGTKAIDRAIADTSDDNDVFLAQLTPAETAGLTVDTYTWVFELNDGTSNFELRYVIDIEPQFSAGLSTQINLQKGVNSFATYETLLLELKQTPSLVQANSVSRQELKSALLTAWQNVGYLTVDFGIEKYSTREFDAADLEGLATAPQYALVRAQIIEADFLLGGNPVEQRRRAGLISDSAGESTHFFRTSKPLEMPVCRDAAIALRGYVSWGIKTGRG